MKLTKVKKRNPKDATFRNINALKRRVSLLERKAKQIPPLIRILRRLNQTLYSQAMEIRELQHRVKKL